ncbi:MAG TPA: phosphodiester glycosidase family protein [Verrucomicrobiae bacterium]
MNVGVVVRTAFLTTAFFLAATVRGEMIIGPWTPLFKGIDYSVSTNMPDTTIPRLQVAHTVRVDLHDPDVKFLTTPRIEDNYIQNSREIAAYTPTDFLTRNELQVVINANFFSEGTYYLPPGTPMDLYGLAVSEGTVVSPPRLDFGRAIVFDLTNAPTFIPLTSASMSLTGIHTAVAGNFLVLTNGTNAAPNNNLFDIDPRTVYGLSQDRRYLFLTAIDGRQIGYSEGATFRDCGVWMKALGAHDAINVDGGGSTTLVTESSTGEPMRLNSSSAVADSGRERTVGSHFGIWAKPVPGFINDVAVQPGINVASISFTTLAPAMSEVYFGNSTELGTTNVVSSTDEANHSIQLTDLTPDTGYYFRLAAISNGVQQVSPLYFFATTNITTTNLLFDYTNVWKFSHLAQSDTNWAQPTFNDTNWISGPGLLWIDDRIAAGVEPRNTPLPINPASDYPYTNYYFRTQFDFGAVTPGSWLRFEGKIDDGAVFYLNGVEIYRLRMPTNSTAGTLANGFPCSGNATCVDEFKIPFSALTMLLPTNNVLAVEAHNYNARSGDITFGLALHRIDSVPPVTPTPAQLTVTLVTAGVEISWEGTGGVIESATEPDGEWTLVETTTTNRVVVPIAAENHFYRLRR